MKRGFFILYPLTLSTCLTVGCARTGLPPRAEFAKHPSLAGWFCAPNEWKPIVANWAQPDGNPGGRFISVSLGIWNGPLFGVTPFEWYRLRFRSRCAGPGYWAAVFYDEHGRQMEADDCGGIEPSDAWKNNEFSFRAKAGAVVARLQFRPVTNGQDIAVDDIEIEPTSPREVATRADKLYATLPAVSINAVPERWNLLSRTRQKLSRGGDLRIVMLGDSIINDIGNSPMDVLIARRFPRAKIQLVTSVGGGKGCTFYQRKNRVQQYVLDYQPDLLIIGGICHENDVEAIRSVIHQVRTKSDPEILLMTGAVANRLTFNPYSMRMTGEELSFSERSSKMAAEENAAFFPMRQEWDRYIHNCGQPVDFFRRDIVHANARGREILARMLEQFFSDG